ncbi:hypothetical protein RSAG8_06984, partial [Rhizoctonia solani AG-8 WAC10335]
MSSRLPRSPHVPHSTANTHPITASHAKSHVLAGVQDAYWSDDEDENLECPLCLEEMDLSDLHFKPCPCGYQICNFCWHHIKENLNGRCPACRREYTEQPAEFKSVTAEEQKRLNAQKRKRDKERKELEALNRRHLANVRIVQRNLVYVTGLGSRFAKEELLPSLRSSEYFGQYGKVSKILLVKRAATLNRPADVGVYITYHRREDAARAIAAVDGSPSPGGGGQIMRASYGTTKYCMNFLRGVQCTNNSCLDLHEWGDERDCFTKEDLATLKHAMKDSETRTSAPPIGAALPRGASWGQNRGALPPAPAALPSSTSSGFPAITASLASSAQSSRQQRSSKARPLSTHIEPKTSYTGAFNPFADGPGSLNRASSYDSERDAAERTSSRFGFARRQDSPGQVSSGYGAMVTSSPMRLYDQLPPEAPMSPPLATSTQWQYNHTTVDYGHQGMIPMNMTPNSMPQQLYVPPGLGQQHYNGMELNAAGLKELLNIGGNLSGARIDARRSQTDAFDARFVARPFSDPAIMSVAPREIFSTGPNLSQTHMPHLGPSTPGQPQANLAVFQSPPGIHALPVLSPPPGFAPPARPHPARQSTNPLTIGPMADSPMLTNASIIKSEPGSPTLSASDFPALPPPSADTQTKRETNQPFLQPRVTTADAKAAVLAAKKASGVATNRVMAPSKPTIKTTTKSTTDDTPLTTSPLNPTGNIATHTETAPKSISASSGPASKDSVADRPGKKASSQAAPKASTTTDSRSTPATSKPGSVEQSNAGSVRRKSNATLPSAGTAKSTTAPAPKPSILIPTPDPVEHVPILSRKQKKNKPVPPRPVVKLPKDESAKTESVTPSAPSSPVSTLLRFEDGSSPPTPLTAEPAMLPEPSIFGMLPSIFGMLVELAAQYEIERLAFFDSQSYNTKLATPLRYGPLVQALSTLSMSGNPAPRSITPGTIDTAVTSFQQLLETLTQTISDMLRTLPRTTWDDTSPFDGVLKDMLKAEEFLEENTDDLPNWRDDDVTVLTQALEKRARWMEIQLVKLEELHRDINTSAVRSVLDQNDRGWGPRAREPRGESLASFEELGYVEQNGAKRAMSIAELEAALVGAREKETVAETELKEAMLAAY